MEQVLEALKQRPEDFLRGEKGEDFEKNIGKELKNQGYEEVLEENFNKDEWKKIRDIVQEEVGEKFIKNETEEKNCFVMGPYGSQKYPDILLFEKDYIIPIELKFSEGNTSKPMWNSGLPRQNSIYIFGAKKREEITFFLGTDVVKPKEAKAFHEHLNKSKEATIKYSKANANSQKYGFVPQVRKAFAQNKVFNKSSITNFFNNPDRTKLEDNVIKKIKELSK